MSSHIHYVPHQFRSIGSIVKCAKWFYDRFKRISDVWHFMKFKSELCTIVWNRQHTGWYRKHTSFIRYCRTCYTRDFDMISLLAIRNRRFIIVDATLYPAVCRARIDNPLCMRHVTGWIAVYAAARHQQQQAQRKNKKTGCQNYFSWQAEFVSRKKYRFVVQ